MGSNSLDGNTTGPSMRNFLIGTTMLLSGAANALTFEVGVNHNTFDSVRLDADVPFVQLKVAHGGLYGWAGYDRPNVRLVGQRMGDIELISYGVGVQGEYGRLRPFLEFGRFEPDATTKDVIRDEAVVTELNNIHGRRGNRHFKETEYNIDSEYGGRVGVLVDLSENVAVSAAYQFLQLNEQLQAYTGKCEWPPTEECESWWVDNRKLDISSFQVGIYFRL